ncbi:MAG: hypothetical protein KF900_00650 [Bacteroidetes bacterium]|nr:hypothetical protein [Bacteroidota bacterium]
MKFTNTGSLGWANMLLTGALSLFLLYIALSGFRENSICEFCTIMLFPGLIFLLFFIAGLYTVLSKNISSLSKKRWLNVINVIGIILSMAAIVFNLTA